MSKDSLTLQQFKDIIRQPQIYSLRIRYPLRIRYSNYLTTNEMVERTWQERLFDLPWRPWKKYKWERRPAICLAKLPHFLLDPLARHSPNDIAYVLAHPSFKDQIEKALEETK